MPDLKLKISRDELGKILDRGITIKKTWACDPEYVVIRWFKRIKELLCGKRSK